ncbi:MAG: hypothetical protein JWO94_2907 [Verrucomicrobiaceae bacterium]|nr:hypothetical protein [Verrucomicrobiaceae bacterium]
MLKLLALSLAVTASLAHAETAPDFDWVMHAGGPKHDKTRCICTDAKGDVFIAGEFSGTSDWDGRTITSTGDLDFFVAKLDPAGKVLWVRTGGGSKTDRGYGVACDAAGNCYVTGHFQSEDCKFDGQALPLTGGGYDIFVGKYDPEGKLQWITSGGGAGYDYGHGIMVSATGDVFVTGGVVGSAAFGEQKLERDKASHVFCADYSSSDGALKWVKVAEGKSSSSGHGVSVDGAGNAYVGGFSGGLGKLGGVELTNEKGSDILIAKFTPQGEVAWVQQGFGSPHAMIHEISADKDGRVWACGMYKEALHLEDGKVVASRGDNDLLLTCIDPAGKRVWTVAGGGPKTDYGLGVVGDGRGGCVLTGEISDTAEILGQSLTSRGATDIYVAGIDGAGKLRWLKQAGGPQSDSAYTIAQDASGNLFFSGAISATAAFDAITVTTAGAGDVYVAKLKAPATPSSAK